MLAAHKIMFLESMAFTVVLVFCAIALGAVIGGIVYGIVWRTSHPGQPGGSWVRCPSCGAHFSFAHSIPVVGWALQGGVCNQCGEPLPFSIPASQLMGAGVFASIVLRHGISMKTIELLALATVLMVVALSTLSEYRIPNACIWLALAIRACYLVYLFLTGGPALELATTSAIGMVALGVPLMIAVWLSNALLARDFNGMGTVKLVAVVGCYLGWQQGIISVAGSIALWLLVWIVSPNKLIEVEVEGGVHSDGTLVDLPSPRDMHATREEDVAEPMRLIPFAPAIIIGLWIMLLLGVDPAVWSSPIF